MYAVRVLSQGEIGTAQEYLISTGTKYWMIKRTSKTPISRVMLLASYGDVVEKFKIFGTPLMRQKSRILRDHSGYEFE
jgi:hypothetical protein